MSILVTGANGLVGSRVLARLEAAGQPAIGVGREQIDLRRHPERLTALIADHRASGVIHCAAMTDVDACESDPQGAWALNVEAVAAAAKARVRLTALSTDYVFDGARGDYSEEDVPEPRGVYAPRKRAGEEAALFLSAHPPVSPAAALFYPS